MTANNDNCLRDHELLSKYDGRIPRYTSYPTAAQFTPEVGPAQHRAWLAALPDTAPVSLYIHIPFCQRLCWYCGCNTRVVRSPELISRYVEGLELELGMIAKAHPARLKVAEIHLGGGTPNMLSAADLDRLFGVIRTVFDVSPNAEISAECDPASVTQAWAAAAAGHGLSRVSLGVQDLNPAVQHAVNRVESYDQVRDAVGWFREAGVASVNFDLMYGLPRQTGATLRDTLNEALTLKPDRVALFGYAHVPWMKSNQQMINDAELPGPQERLIQARRGAAVLEEAGYQRIGIDHFALTKDSLAAATREGDLHRNFQGYSTDACESLIAIGASGISKMPQGYAQNHTAEIAWRAALDRGELPVARGVALTEGDRFRAEIIERLMCDLAVDLAAVCARHDRKPADLYDEREALKEFIRDGLLTRQGDRLEMTEAGRPFVRAVCAVFDVYLKAGAARHSHAV